MGGADVDWARRRVAGSLGWLGVLGLAGCGGGVSIFISDEDDHTTVSYNFVVGYDARVLPAGNHVLRSQADLDRLWSVSQPYPDGPVVPGSAPAFDFAGFTLVAIALGVGLLCDQPRLVGVTASGSTLTVSYRTDRDRTFGCTRTGPLQLLLAVPRRSGDILFRRVT